MKINAKYGGRATITGAFIGALATACGGSTTDPLEANDSAGPGPASNAEAEAPYLFRDPNVSGPKLDIIEADGNIAVSVGGPIGTEGDVLSLLRPDSSLVELYRALHPSESEVPSDLEALDELVTPLMADLVASAPREAPAAAVLEKSQSSFNSTVCKTFREGSSEFIPVVCRWFARTPIVLITVDDSIRAGDRVYGWNAASSAAQIEFICSGCSIAPIALPPFWWTFAWMTSGGPFDAVVDAPSGAQGERGGTHHKLFPIIR